MQELEFCHLAAISIHAPAKGATINHRIFRWVFSRFQSTLPRRERRLKALVIAVWMPISIHAPAKGATYFRSIFRGIFRFQSTLPRRERQVLPAPRVRRKKISIHAPAKGATPCRYRFRHLSAFQSTLPRRERQIKTTVSDLVRRFQSTLPRRERQLKIFHFLTPFLYFNPRSREGSDHEGSYRRRWRSISIHAPAKGATDDSKNSFSVDLFQSTLPRRERPSL